MRHLFISLLFLCLASPSFSSSKWLSVEISIVGAASQDILSQSFTQAKKIGAQGVIVQLDTPGGALDATRAMVKEMMAQPFPVVVWVGPAGARAGSAGAFLTIAAHVAAMAPGTNIGAAHPVQASGKDIGDSDAAKKVENDTSAFMESIAQVRGRNVDMAVSFVVNSLSVTAKEALEGNIIDLIASDTPELLEKLDGRQVALSGDKKVTLATRGVDVVVYEKSIKQRFLEILSHPSVFYLLFMAGLMGLGFELTHPGSLIPGVLGGLSLILALIAMSVLPVNIGGLILIAASIGFVVAEAFVPSFGILGIGGVVGFIAGSLLLVDPSNEQGLRLSWQIILPTAVTFLGLMVVLLWLVVKSERKRTLSGAEGMIGEKALVLKTIKAGKAGRVRYDGEDWRAISDASEDIEPDESVLVVSREGLLLKVERISEKT